MSIKLILFLFLLSDCAYTHAQKKIYTIYSSEDLSRLPTEFRFLYPDFRKGHILFVTNKKSAPYKFNYDLLNKRLLFINDKNDTLAVGEMESIKTLHMEKDLYYYDLNKGILKVLASDTLYALVSLIELRSMPLVKPNEGYGGSNNGTTATATVSRSQDFTIEKSSSYYLMDKNRSVIEGTRSEFMKAFKAKGDQVRQFIKSNHIDFTQEADLIKLFQFCVK